MDERIVIKRGDFECLKKLLNERKISQDHFSLLEAKLSAEDVVVESLKEMWGYIKLNEDETKQT